MIIKETRYKDVLAICLKTMRYEALVLPTEGGKTVSFKEIDNEKEYLLQRKGENYRHIGLLDDFVQGECSGFDDMFPTVDPITLKDALGKEHFYHDHGEVCRVPFEYSVSDNELVLKYTSPFHNYDYIKKYSEDEDGKLVLSYSITNHSSVDLDGLWAGHCLINLELGGQLILPYKEGEDMDVVADSSGKYDRWQRIPYKKEILDSIWDKDTKECRKVYFPKECANGVISYRYPNGKEFVMEFDSKELKYVGIWVCHGGLIGDFCMGLEPCTVGYDTVTNAERYGKKRVIHAGETQSFFVKLSVK